MLRRSYLTTCWKLGLGPGWVSYWLLNVGSVPTCCNNSVIDWISGSIATDSTDRVFTMFPFYQNQNRIIKSWSFGCSVVRGSRLLMSLKSDWLKYSTQYTVQLQFRSSGSPRQPTTTNQPNSRFPVSSSLAWFCASCQHLLVDWGKRPPCWHRQGLDHWKNGQDAVRRRLHWRLWMSGHVNLMTHAACRLMPQSTCWLIAYR